MSLDSFAFTKEDQSFKLAFSKKDSEWYFYSTHLSKNYFLSICSKEVFLNDGIKVDFKGIKAYLV
jgi:hypothetical protein